MHSIAGFIIRSSAFIQKELVEILRQTRLILALVLGPFLILLLFGLGYRNQARVLRTLFVVPKDEAAASAQIEQYANSLGPQLDYRGITTNKDQALSLLQQGNVDVVAVIPDNIEQKILNSQQPVVTLYHREIDPLQVSYVQYFAQIYVDELNRRILVQSAQRGQQEAAQIQQNLQTAKQAVHAMRLAFEQNNAAAAEQQRQKSAKSLDAVSLGLGATLSILQGVEQTVGPGGTQEGAGPAGQILNDLAGISASMGDLANTNQSKTNYSAEAKKAAQIEQDLNKLDTDLSNFRKIDPQVLISPFKGEAKSVSGLTLSSSDFFTPGVIILLLQHLAVTFAALSIVRERISGAMELFRVSPISAFEVLLGKYLSYMLLGTLLAAGISALVLLVLRVPMLGSWVSYSFVLLAVLFTSLGFGFFISLVTSTNSQAVQYSMLVLLFSIFFSGFFLDLRLMQPAMQVLAWIIPTTYGMNMLQEIMFRGNPIAPFLMAGLLAIGLFMFAVSWLLLRHQMKLH